MMTKDNKTPEQKPESNSSERAGILGQLTDLLLNTHNYKEAFSRLILFTGVAAIGVGTWTIYEVRGDLLERLLTRQHARWVLAQEEVRATHVPSLLESLRTQYNADSVTLWAFHNGTQTLRKSAVYSSGVDLPLDQLDGLPATLDDTVFLEMFRGRCVLGVVNESNWSVSSRLFFKKIGTYYDISCPVVVNSDLSGYISISWSKDSYQLYVTNYPTEEIIRSVTDTAYRIGAMF